MNDISKTDDNMKKSSSLPNEISIIDETKREEHKNIESFTEQNETFQINIISPKNTTILEHIIKKNKSIPGEIFGSGYEY